MERLKARQSFIDHRGILKWFIALILVLNIIFASLPSMQIRNAFASEPAQQQSTTMEKVRNVLSLRTENNVLNGAMPCRGNAHMLVIDLCLQDKENELSTDDIRNMLFGDSYSYGSSVRNENVTDYFKAVSYGKLNVTGDVVNYVCDEYPENTDLPGILDEVLSEIEDISIYDCNNDGYFDGICFIYPDKVSSDSAHVGGFRHEYNGYMVGGVIHITNENYKSASTFIHETVHLMGLPDIYAKVSVNPSGTMADSVMDGSSSRWTRTSGSKTNDIPGIMKYLFGWIEDVTEVYEVGTTATYTLPSYSINPSAMVIYPNGDTDSKFVFFVENFTAEGNNWCVEGYDYVGTEGGLRIWKVYLNVDDNGAIIGNDRMTGCGMSPYKYLECINDGSKFILKPGMELTADTTPSSAYHDEFYFENNSCYPSNFLDSNVEIRNLSQTENGAVFDLLILAPEECEHSYLAVETPPTCENSGYTTYTCSVCGDSYTDNEIPALGEPWFVMTTELETGSKMNLDINISALDYSSNTWVSSDDGLFIDWGDGNIVRYSEDGVTAGSEIKVYWAYPDAVSSFVDCSSNELTALTVNRTYGYSDTIICRDNLLKFSTLPLNLSDDGHGSAYSGFTYDSQKPVVIPETVTAGNAIDLSSEYRIDSIYTNYTWYDTDGNVVEPFTANNGKFTFDNSAAGKVLYCEMINIRFPNLTLRTTEVTIEDFSYPVPDADDPWVVMTTELDVGSKLNLDISLSYFDKFWFTVNDSLYIDWGDGNIVRYSVDGVTAGKVIKVYWACPDAITSSFDCSSNELTALTVTRSYGYHHTVTCRDNLLKFSTLPLNLYNAGHGSSYSGFYYDSQKPVVIPETIAPGDAIDLSSEFEIDGVRTVYTWYDADGNAVTPATADNGIFTFDRNVLGSTLHCEMTNTRFNLLTLKTTEVFVKSGTNDCYGDNHQYKVVVTAPTCEKKGYTTYTCYHCGYSYTADETPMTEHSWKDADCKSPRTCSLCGLTTGNKGSHTYDDNVDGTCNVCRIHRETTENRTVMHMFRMYDPNSGEHFYTGSELERDFLVAEGWNYEGVGFTFSMTTGAPVHRLYDPVTYEHLYTMDEDEKARLMAAGWNYEGVAFNSAYDTEVPQYRLHNPNETRGAYHFTASIEERDYLISLGWEDQGIGFYSSWK